MSHFANVILDCNIFITESRKTKLSQMDTLLPDGWLLFTDSSGFCFFRSWNLNYQKWAEFSGSHVSPISSPAMSRTEEEVAEMLTSEFRCPHGTESGKVGGFVAYKLSTQTAQSLVTTTMMLLLWAHVCNHRYLPSNKRVFILLISLRGASFEHVLCLGSYIFLHWEWP